MPKVIGSIVSIVMLSQADACCVESDHEPQRPGVEGADFFFSVTDTKFQLADTRCSPMSRRLLRHRVFSSGNLDLKMSSRFDTSTMTLRLPPVTFRTAFSGSTRPGNRALPQSACDQQSFAAWRMDWIAPSEKALEAPFTCLADAQNDADPAAASSRTAAHADTGGNLADADLLGSSGSRRRGSIHA